MINRTTETPLALANELRPVLLRLTRELRRETEQFGITGRQATLLWLVKRSPGLTLRALAETEGISPPALSGHVDRLERAGLLVRVRSTDRPAPRRPRADAGGRAPPPLGARAPHGLARRAARRARAREPSRRSAAALEPLRDCSARSAMSTVALALQRANLPQPPPPPQLPALLRGPDRLARRLVDAERRARLARALPLPLAARGRNAALLPLRAVHALRPLRRLDRRPARYAAARRLDAGRGDARLGRTRGRDPDRHRDAPDRLRARDARRRHARPRRAGSAVADLRDGRPARAAERRRAQLRPAQRLPRDRPGDRRRADRRRRASASASSSTRSASSPCSRRLLAMREDELFPVARDRATTVLAGRARGLRSPGATAQVRAVLIVVTCVGLVGFNFNTLVPLLAADTLARRRDGVRPPLGGVRARRVCGRDRHGVVRGGEFGVRSGPARSASACSSSPSPPSHDARLAGGRSSSAIGACFTLFAANANALVQLAAPDQLRGRLVALYLFAFVGLAPLGSLLSGTLVEVGGTRLAFVVAGIVGPRRDRRSRRPRHAPRGLASSAPRSREGRRRRPADIDGTPMRSRRNWMDDLREPRFRLRRSTRRAPASCPSLRASIDDRRAARRP